jgi:nucleotide-binding universal stress UspA family protein
MLRRILVPLDGSPHAKAAVSVAADIAIRTDAQLHLVHVVEVPEALAYPEYRAEDRAWAEQELAEIAAETAPGRVAVSTSVRGGEF